MLIKLFKLCRKQDCSYNLFACCQHLFLQCTWTISRCEGEMVLSGSVFNSTNRTLPSHIHISTCNMFTSQAHLFHHLQLFRHIWFTIYCRLVTKLRQNIEVKLWPKSVTFIWFSLFCLSRDLIIIWEKFIALKLDAVVL